MQLTRNIDERTLSHAACRVLGKDTAELAGLQCRSIWRPRLTSTQGVYRVNARFMNGGTTSQSSLVLKVQPLQDEGMLPREADLYESGALRSLHGGLVAAHCYEVMSLSGKTVGIWLEYIGNLAESLWSIEHFRLAATHLGELVALNSGPAISAAKAVPTRNLVGLRSLCDENLDQLSNATSHPRVRYAYPPFIARSLRRMWDDSAPVLEAMEQVPYLLCHGDAQRRNLFIGHDSVGRTKTIAID